jgi:hypothetical protein
VKVDVFHARKGAMSYIQAVKWGRKHPKGTRQPVIFSTGSGFWPSRAWLEEDWSPYVEECKKINITPLPMDEFYHKTTHLKYQRDPASYAAMTREGNL